MRFFPLAVAFFSALVLALPLHADTVTLITNQNGNSDNWNTAADWSDGQAPSSSNNYYTGSYTLRAATSFFSGASLTVNGGTLLVPNTGSAFSTGLNYLNLTGGTVSNPAGSGELEGNQLNLTGTNTLLAATGSSLNLSYAAFTGSGTLILGDVSGSYGGTYTLAMSTSFPSPYTGTLEGLSGTLSFQLGADLSNADLVIGAGMASVEGGFKANELTVDGISFAAGVYTGDEINETVGRDVFGGSDLITVTTPEPSTVALLALALGGVVLGFRRLRPVRA